MSFSGSCLVFDSCAFLLVNYCKPGLVHTARRYFSARDTLSADYCLLLEDMSPLVCYGLGRECSDSQLDTLVAALARLHRRFMGTVRTDPRLVELVEKNSSRSKSDSVDAAMASAMRVEGWKHLLAIKDLDVSVVYRRPTLVFKSLLV